MHVYSLFKDNPKTYYIQWREAMNHKKISTTINMHMPPPKTPKDIQVFNDVTQLYHCFIWDFAFIKALISKLLMKVEAFD